MVNTSSILSTGYTYDASVNPVWLPGRYNNLHFPRTTFRDLQTGLLRIPASSSPRMRLPLFWLAFKNYPYALFKKLCLLSLKRDGYLSLYFHPWEFADIHAYHLPGYVTKDCGEPLLAKLKRLINDLKKEASFITMNEYALLQQSKLLINH